MKLTEIVLKVVGAILGGIIFYSVFIATGTFLIVLLRILNENIYDFPWFIGNPLVLGLFTLGVFLILIFEPFYVTSVFIKFYNKFGSDK